MICFSARSILQLCIGTLGIVIAGSAGIAADRPGDRGGGRPPVYQRRGFDWSHGHGNLHRQDHGRRPAWSSPQVSAGWFQRPYPYHLDYYRMRYGGSYAPYFGNLYGPPQVVTAPPYYGPYYGGYDMANGYYRPDYGNGPAQGEIVSPPVDTPTPSSENGDGPPSSTGP